VGCSASVVFVGLPDGASVGTGVLVGTTAAFVGSAGASAGASVAFGGTGEQAAATVAALTSAVQRRKVRRETCFLVILSSRMVVGWQGKPSLDAKTTFVQKKPSRPYKSPISQENIRQN